MRSEKEIFRDIERFLPNDGNWLGLDTLVAELWERTPSLTWVEPLLEVFDRFPNEDGAGVLWTIVHGIEEIDGYEPVLKQSARKKPCELKDVMLKRIENAKDS